MGTLSKLKVGIRSYSLSAVVAQTRRFTGQSKQDLGCTYRHSYKESIHRNHSKNANTAGFLKDSSKHLNKTCGRKHPRFGLFPQHPCSRTPFQFHRCGVVDVVTTKKRQITTHVSDKPRMFCSVSSSSSSLTNGVSESSEEFLPVDVSEIKSFLNENNITFSDGFTCINTSCAKHKGKKTFKNKVYINMTTGYFVCFNCGKSGSWSQFKDTIQAMMSAGSQKKDSKLPAECLENVQLDGESTEAKNATIVWEKARPIMELAEEDWDSLQHDLQINGLELSTLDKFGVRALVDSGRRGLVIPLMNHSGSIIGVKTVAVESRSVAGKNKKTVVTRSIPRVNYSGLFGLRGEKPNSSVKAIITSNEFDAMAIHQMTGRVVFSLPKADSILPQKVLPYLEKFKEITIWLGGDAKTWDSAKQFARKLNESRCYLIRPSVKHANALACVQKETSISGVLRQAHPAVHKSIISFRDLRQDVYDELSQAEQVVGVKWKRYLQLNKLLKGHRRGELTVFTGPTGAGKTTFISDYSLDLALQGVNTLWGSFEINNVRLMKTMITQFSQMNLSRNLGDFSHWADKFEELPVYFMTFHGQEEIKSVIETMSHAVYVHDIAHVVVDNLQFMMGVDDSLDRFVKQDKVISAFRRFATNNNCHVTIVVHPRKERDTEELTISSIFGSAKASQEADNILILQDKRLQMVRGKKYIQVAKNRFDGDLGVMMLEFDKDALSFALKKTRTDKSSEKTKTSEAQEASSLTMESSEMGEEMVPELTKSSRISQTHSSDQSNNLQEIEKRLIEVEVDFDPVVDPKKYQTSEYELEENERFEIKEYHSAGSKGGSEIIDYIMEEQETESEQNHCGTQNEDSAKIDSTDN